MNAIVNENCISCGLCCDICPAVFTMGDDGFAHGGPVASEQKNLAKEAQDGCPSDAIRIEE